MKKICLAAVIIAACAFTIPAAAQQNSYGGFDIVGKGQKSEAPYGDVRGWRVFSAKVSNNFAYCVAVVYRGDGTSVRLGWDGMQWQLAAPVKSKPDWQGTLQIDGQGAGQGYQRGGDYISGTANAGWTIAWLGEAELDGVRKGKSAVLSIGKANFDFSLSGAAATILKIQECVGRLGKS